MPEMRQAVPHDDFSRHLQRAEGLALEIGDVERLGVYQRMNIEIDQCAGSVFDSAEALIERTGRQ